jgi:hypothetical protein
MGYWVVIAAVALTCWPALPHGGALRRRFKNDFFEASQVWVRHPSPKRPERVFSLKLGDAVVIDETFGLGRPRTSLR